MNFNSGNGIGGLSLMDKKQNLIEEAQVAPINEKNIDFFTKTFPENKKYSKEAIENDMAAVRAKRNAIVGSNYNQNVEESAQCFECMLVDWLDADFLAGKEIKAQKTMVANEFDDDFNGVDVYKRIGGVAIGFDATIASDEKIINGKLRPFRNGKPYGCTEIKYYAEKQNRNLMLSDEQNLVPRFVVGISKKNVDKLVDNYDGVKGEKILGSKQEAVLTRFKILSEVREQAQLYLDKLPDMEEKREMIKEVRDKFEKILAMTEEPMEKCARKLVSEEKVPDLYEAMGKIKVFLCTPKLKVRDSDEWRDNKAYDSTYAEIVRQVGIARDKYPDSIKPEENMFRRGRIRKG